jgi:O-antigen ligase
MAVFAPSPTTHARAPRSALVLALAAAAALILPTAVIAAAVFDQVDVPPAMALAGGLAFAGYVLVAVRYFDVAVALSFLLSGVVLVEPAPPDAAFSVLIAIALATGRFRPSHAPGSILLALSVLLGLNILSMMEAVSVSTGLRFAFITAYLFAFAVWLAGYINSERRTRILVVAWLTIALSTALIGLLAWAMPIPTRGLWLTSDFERVKGLFKDPNVFGPFLVPITMILLDQQMRPRLLRLRTPTALLLLGILALGILFAFSRAAWGNAVVAFVITLGTAAMARRGRARALRTLVGVSVVGIAVVGVLGATGSMGFLHQRAQLQTYDTDRFAAQHAGYELGWTHPVGVGPGQFQYHHNVETHSTYVRTLAEQGFGGLAAWLAILVITLILAVQNTLRGWSTYGIGAGALLGSWCGLIVNSAVVDTLHWRHLWVVAPLIWVGALSNRRAEQAAQRRESSGSVLSPPSAAPL